MAIHGRWESVGLNEEEYGLVVSLLGREPNDLELGLYGVMWSEHCSYKSSRRHLGILPVEGPGVLQGPGENAGVVDIGDGLAVAFRIESHNHPSAIEPYQGAATGVGGILRDIFTMGARPIALLDSLRFGPLTDPRNRYLCNRVVAGIADYGNSCGVPTVGGEIYFDDCYRENCLVNVMCVGLLRAEELVKGRAAGPGNPVLLVGARTGRDGIHGASLLASREFDEAAEEMRPAVQVGDPFREKCLIEACLELMREDFVIGVNDLGAAGLTSACSETASRGGAGMEIDVALVPRREEGMNPYEVMLSESQERMLAIIRDGSEARAAAIFERWGLEATPIGRVTGDGMLRVLDGGRTVAELPAHTLTDGAPAYLRPMERPAYLDRVQRLDLASLNGNPRAASALMALLGSSNLAARPWVWRQYDHMIQINTVGLPGSDAALLRAKGTPKGLALTTDGNGRYCYLDPYLGGAIAVAEAARNLSCTGARPLGLTNCLNFGNPEKPETMWMFRRVLEGMAEACRVLGIPVTGGNVSFYNETEGRPVYPTPVVGMVGLLEDIDRRVNSGFRGVEGDLVVLLGDPVDPGDPALGLGGSEYLKVVQGQVAGKPPAIDLERERRVQECCRAAVAEGLLLSAHDCAEGGLAVALAESCLTAREGDGGEDLRGDGILADGLQGDDSARDGVRWDGEHGHGACGIRLDLPSVPGVPAEAILFGEAQSRIVAGVEAGKLPRLEALASEFGVPFHLLGVVGGRRFTIRAGTGDNGSGSAGETLIDLEIKAMKERWTQCLPKALE